MIRKQFKVVNCNAANVWRRAFGVDESCIGTLIQNQHATAKWWVCNREPSMLEEAARIDSNSGLLEDILPGQEEVYVYCDTADAKLTYIKKVVS
jgi:hypothetical protein